MLKFSTKAETLSQIEGRLKTAIVLPQVRFSSFEASNAPQSILDAVKKAGMIDGPVIVRSSSLNEDAADCSNAGKFLSVGNVFGSQAIIQAVRRVADAMGHEPDNQLFIQPFLESVEMCGVAFTADPNTGGNYYIINYDASTGSTSSVTDGSGASLETFYHFKESPYEPPAMLGRVIDLCAELEVLFSHPALDVEFAIAGADLYLLQVRPLVMRRPVADIAHQKQLLRRIASKFSSSMHPHPDLCSSTTVFGVMPDWNPAEMIGIRPNALALSLYRDIITDSVWAYQRDNYGYRNLRSFPLMVDFCGLPYIDARVSFNSFMPKSLPEPLAEKLAEYYIERLRSNPELHDKIEFEIAFTCYTFDLPQRIKAIGAYGFSEEEQSCIVNALRDLTNSIIPSVGLWSVDAGKIEVLRNKHLEIMASELGTLEKIYWLLEYCKRYGTLPFAGLARAGFIAVELLRSMVAVGVLSDEERAQYMSGLSTIGKNISKDFAAMNPGEFMQRYGHLRPGTYNICSLRYDQSDDRYFDFSKAAHSADERKETEFRLSLSQYATLQKLLDEHGLETDVLSLFDFIKAAIEGREYAKFVFTHTLSDALELVSQLGKEYGFSREDMSHVTIQRIAEAYSTAVDMEAVLKDSIKAGKKLEEEASGLTLPPLIWEESQIYSFFQPEGAPNYITQKECIADAVVLPSEKALDGKIVLIRSADPGYDWVFSHPIAGFITAYGGANSHMAIRAAEFGIPAVIGVGEKLFARYSAAKRLQIDCRNRNVLVL